MAVNTGYTTNNSNQAQDSTQVATGRFTMSAAAITTTDYVVVNVGFVPRYIRVENVTDRTSAEWFEGMGDDTCIKTAAAGTRTLEVSGGNKGLGVCQADATADPLGRNFKISQNATLAVILASKVINWYAIG